jgi:signal transduction histidine kinase/CheY-like chemotaxis protein
MTWPIVSLTLKTEADIVTARLQARRLAELLKFDRHDQTRIATAVSEIARNAFLYANGGSIDFSLIETDGRQLLSIRVSDQGGGIDDLDSVLEGRHRTSGGAGGIAGARRLMDAFRIESSADGTVVELGHRLPTRAPRVSRAALDAVAANIKQRSLPDPLSALHEQNRELLHSLEDIRRRQDETEKLNLELQDTNRGVVALYAELEARAEQLRQASEIKSRFLSNMSHEFRTPLNSILALSRMLLDGIDGALNTEQQRQVGYIRQSAQDLLELVGDLLDLAKVEAGKVELKLTRFTVEEMFGALRGALKPLRDRADVDLIFEAADDLPPLYCDEGKVSQVLRNFVSNALKFTEHGEVRVSAHHDSRQHRIVFLVADTGIGIAATDQELIFEEFSQVDGHLQKNVKGTGLGLPLSRKLAELMNGEVWVESELGKGSAFYLAVPVQLGPVKAPAPHAAAATRKRILIVDDDSMFRYILRGIIADQLHYDVIEACDGLQGLERIRAERPDAVVLDLQMPKMDGFAVVQALHDDPQHCPPLIVATSLPLDEEPRSHVLDGIPILPKQDVSGERIGTLLTAALGA